jgi:hypothetical protein
MSETAQNLPGQEPDELEDLEISALENESSNAELPEILPSAGEEENDEPQLDHENVESPIEEALPETPTTDTHPETPDFFTADDEAGSASEGEKRRGRHRTHHRPRLHHYDSKSKDTNSTSSRRPRLERESSLQESHSKPRPLSWAARWGFSGNSTLVFMGKGGDVTGSRGESPSSVKSSERSGSTRRHGSTAGRSTESASRSGRGERYASSHRTDGSRPSSASGAEREARRVRHRERVKTSYMTTAVY